MSKLLQVLYLIIATSIVGYFGYSAWYGRAFWESNVQRNTEYTGKRVYTGYGNRLNHK